VQVDIVYPTLLSRRYEAVSLTMKRTMCFVLSTTITFLIGCRHQSPPQTPIGSPSGVTKEDAVDPGRTSSELYPDTSIILTFRGEEFRFLVVRNSITKELYEDFQRFLSNQGNSTNLTLHTARLDDFDGDGILDTLLTSIEPTSFGSRLTQVIIRSTGDTIYSHCWDIDNDRGNPEDIWGSDSVYTRFKPFSSYYRAAQETLRFRGSRDFVNYRRFAPPYVHEYNGKLLDVSEFVERHVEFFDPVRKKFILLYSP